MKEAGVTAVLNVQTQTDMDHRGVNWPKMLEMYKGRGIAPVHFPIHDFNQADLIKRLFEAANALDVLVKRGEKVYVHCTAGMGRAPAVVLAYLCLFKKVEDWDDPAAVDLWLKSHRKVCTPNMTAVTQVIEENKWFQENQSELFD